MNHPIDEQALVAEVIYLHSLWHQGPPPPPPPSSQSPNPFPISSLNPFPIPIPNPQFHASPWHLHPHHHQEQHTDNNHIPTAHPIAAPTHTRSSFPLTTFNKNKKNSRRDPAAAENVVSQPDSPPSQGPEWPVPDLAGPPAASGWPAPKKVRLAAPPPPELSPQEKERLAVLQAQNKARKAFREFMLGDDEDKEEEDEDEEEIGDVDDDDAEKFEGFFMRIFTEDDGLRSYYQSCFESGEFRCLVCGAVGKKSSGKKFKDCAGLVQHSMSILRTVKKRAHRAFGHAVCKVLGWDIDRLPVIVMKGEPLGCSVKVNPSEVQGRAKENTDEGTYGSQNSYGNSVHLANDNDELIQKLAQGFEQSIGGCSTNADNVDEKALDVRLENVEGKATDEFCSKECASNKNSNFDEKNCILDSKMKMLEQ